GDGAQRQSSGGPRNLVATPVVEGDRQVEAIVAGRALLGARDDAAELGAQRLSLAGDADAHAFLEQPLEIGLDEAAHELEEVVPLGRGAIPILGREAEQGEPLGAELAGGLDRAPNRLHAFAVTKGARPVARPRPAAVAVHDDGDVSWTDWAAH